MGSRDTVPGLAERLRAAREAAGLTQAQAAERAGLHGPNVAAFETEVRAPTLKVLYRLADAYGVDVCDLLPSSKKRPKK